MLGSRRTGLSSASGVTSSYWSSLVTWSRPLYSTSYAASRRLWLNFRTLQLETLHQLMCWRHKVSWQESLTPSRALRSWPPLFCSKMILLTRILQITSRSSYGLFGTCNLPRLQSCFSLPSSITKCSNFSKTGEDTIGTCPTSTTLRLSPSFTYSHSFTLGSIYGQWLQQTSTNLGSALISDYSQ